METIKLKILDEAGHTLMTCDADTAVSLVYTNCYKPGDRVALEIDHPGQYCVIQFEDTMPEALVYVVKRRSTSTFPSGSRPSPTRPRALRRPSRYPGTAGTAGRDCRPAESGLQLL